MIRKFSLALLCGFACLCASAQPKVKLQKTEYDLGNIAWHNTASAVIKISNSGNKPLEITEIDPGCECTVVNWDHKTISPGSSTTLTAVYKAETLGTFMRNISVKTNAADAPIYITLKGKVKERVAVDLSAFPFKDDNIRFSSQLIEFDDVIRGEHRDITINIMNAGKKDYVPNFLRLPSWLTFKAHPATLSPGQTGRITFSLNSAALEEYGLTQTNIYLSRYPGDKIHKNGEINVCATLVPAIATKPADGSGEMTAEGPLAVIPAKMCMGAKLGKKRVRGMVYLENHGTETLHVSALQVYNPEITVLLTDQNIKPGERAALKVTVTSNVYKHKHSPRILLMTNDPLHPKISIDLVNVEPAN